METAQPVLNYRRDLSNGDVIHVVVWLRPTPLPGSPHPFKYRLHYQTADGSKVIRYDNERGKGDHRHIEGKEAPYLFETVEQLEVDSHKAIRRSRESGGIRWAEISR